MNTGIQGIYHYKGSVESIVMLNTITMLLEGDVYHVIDENKNYVWDGEEWQEFDQPIEQNQYARIDDIFAMSSNKNAILYSGKTAIVGTSTAIQTLLDNNQEEVEIKIKGNVAMSQPLIIPEGKKVTIDLNGSEIISTGAQAFVASGDGAELVLEGGSIKSNANCTVAAQGGGKVVINGTDIVSTTDNGIGSYGAGSEIIINSGNITGQEYGAIAIDAGNVTINGGTFKGLDNFGVGSNGTAGRGGCTVTINGGVIEGHIQTANYQAVAIYWPNEGTLNFNGGTIITDGAGIVQRGGTVNIGPDAVIQTSNTPTDRVTGRAGDGRNVVGRYAVVYDYNSKYPAYETMQLNIARGAQLNSVDGDLSILPADAPGLTDNR